MIDHRTRVKFHSGQIAGEEPEGFDSEMDYGAGQSPGDSLDGLDLGDDQFPEVVDGRCLCLNDHVVWAGDVLRARYTRDCADFPCDLSRFSDLSLNEDISLYCHAGLLPYGDEGPILRTNRLRYKGEAVCAYDSIC